MTTSLPPLHDGRAITYLVLGAIMLCAGIVTGQIEPTAAAAGFIVASLFGLRRVGSLEVDIDHQIESNRIIEGDRVRLDVTLDGLDPSLIVDIGVVRTSTEFDFRPAAEGASAGHGTPGLGSAENNADPQGESSSRSIDMEVGAGGPRQRVSARLVFDAPMWGRHDLGALVVRVRDEAGLIHWEDEIDDLGKIRVLPRADRLNQLLAPPASHATTGSHPAPTAHGDGSDFLDIREYRPGDRLRDLNWRASARTGTPHINRRIPERGGDVVIVLDTMADRYMSSSEVGAEVMRHAAQAVWALVRNHLAAGDRVGLAIIGSSRIGWIAPSGGNRAKYKVIETLLGSDLSERQIHLRAGSSRLRHDIPQAALVVAVSTLASNQTVAEIAALGSHGRATAIVAINNIGVASARVNIDPQILRVAELTFESEVRRVRRLGLPVVVWRPEHDLDSVIRRLGDMARRRSRATR